MFDVGFFEIILFIVVCLVILKPEQLPGIIRSFGEAMREVRNTVSSVTRKIEQETKPIIKATRHAPDKDEGDERK